MASRRRIYLWPGVARAGNFRLSLANRVMRGRSYWLVPNLSSMRASHRVGSKPPLIGAENGGRVHALGTRPTFVQTWQLQLLSQRSDRRCYISSPELVTTHSDRFSPNLISSDPCLRLASCGGKSIESTTWEKRSHSLSHLQFIEQAQYHRYALIYCILTFVCIGQRSAMSHMT